MNEHKGPFKDGEFPWEKGRNPWENFDHRQFREDMRRMRTEMKIFRFEGPPKPPRPPRPPRSPVRHLFWGLILIMWGVILAAYKQDWLAGGDIWKAAVAGLGAIMLIQAIVEAFFPAFRHQAVGKLTPGVILLLLGLGLLFDWSSWWPAAMVIAGVAVIFISWFLQREIRWRRVTQETLWESEVKYQYIIDNANSAIMEIDTAGKIIFINKFALDFFGFRENEILGQNIVGTIISSGKADDWVDIIEKTANSPENSRQNEMENRRKNGDTVWMAWTYKPIMDEAGRLKEILCTGIDRTQQKQDEERNTREIREQTAVEERNRLARDLHDAVSQTLFSTSLIAEVLPKLWERNKDAGIKKLEEVRLLTRGALAEMRTLLFELRPAALADAELHELLRQLAESVTGRVRVPVALDIKGACEIPTDVKIALYRIAQEALNNIAKHSSAAGATVSLLCGENSLKLQITDNGRGFDVAKAGNGSFGLNNMRERAAQASAELAINSKIDEGTEITVTWHGGAGEVSP